MTVKAAIFMNPNSGSLSWEKKLKRAREAANRLKSIFWREGRADIKIFEEPSKSKNDFQSLLREESKGRDVAVIGSGDGGIGDGLNCIDENCILGYIPLGSGNNAQTVFFFHRMLGGKSIVQTDLIFDELDEKRGLLCEWWIIRWLEMSP